MALEIKKHVDDFRLKYFNESRIVRSHLLSLLKDVEETYEEIQQKSKYNKELAEKISCIEARIATAVSEENRLGEERKKIAKKNSELTVKLKRETSKAEDLQAAVEKERARIEEQEKVSKNIQDQLNLFLKPYNDFLGIALQLSKEPEVSLRIIFQMPTGKKCVVKLNKSGLKIIKCVPMLNGLEKLENRLAKTNDYPGFVTYLRTLFLQQIPNI